MFHRLYLWLTAAGVQSLTGRVRDQGDRDGAAVQACASRGHNKSPLVSHGLSWGWEGWDNCYN